jgi:hypothetical protein
MRFRQVERVLCERLGDEVLLLAPGSSEALRLNPTASLVWNALTEWLTAEELQERALPVAAEDRETVIGDVEALLADLLAQGVIQAA